MIVRCLARVLDIEILHAPGLDERIHQQFRRQLLHLFAAEVAGQEIAARRAGHERGSVPPVRQQVESLGHPLAFRIVLSRLNFNFPEHRVPSWLE